MKIIVVLSLFLTLQEVLIAQVAMQNVITIQEFEKIISKTARPQIIDLRPAPEYYLNHLQNAMNLTAANYDETIKSMDKTKPLFIYASSEVSLNAGFEQLSTIGFSKIYKTLKVEDTVTATMQSKVPQSITAQDSIAIGLSLTDYNKLIKKEKLLLLAFYANWCMPCKTMIPIIDELAHELKGKLVVKKINVDVAPEVVASISVFPIPLFYLYKQGKLEWQTRGLIAKSSLIEKIHSYQ